MNCWTKPTGLLALMVLALISVGCGQSGVVPPPPPPDNTPQLPLIRVEDYANHNLWGTWEITYDLNNLTAIAAHISDPRTHFNIIGPLLQPGCPDCLDAKVNSYDPATNILNLDITLKNNTEITMRDVRGIVFTDDTGHLLTNASAWTGLYDIPGGNIINPFIAYAIDQPERSFTPGLEVTKDFRVEVPVTPRVDTFTFAAEASWPGNCREPYAIPDARVSVEAISDTPGSTGKVEIMVADWQDAIGPVYILAPEIIGDEFIGFDMTGGPDKWNTEIINTDGAPPGEYQALIVAFSEDSASLPLCKYIPVEINKTPVKPLDLTPLQYSFHPTDISSPGDGYAYATSVKSFSEDLSRGWLNIIDISNPAEPYLVNTVLHYSDYISGLHIAAENGYAYISGSNGDFLAIDVAPPEDAHIVITPVTGAGIALETYNGHCLLGDGLSLKVINTTPPGEIFTIQSVPVPYSVLNIAIDVDTAYLHHGSAISYVDISNPEEASLTGTYETQPNDFAGFDISGDVMYTCDSGNVLLFDISEPSSPLEISAIPVPGGIRDIKYFGGYLAVADTIGLHIIDVEPPESAHLVKSLSSPDESETRVDIAGEMIYLTNWSRGLEIYNASDPESVFLEGTYYTFDEGPFTLDNGLLYSPSFSITDPSPAGSLTVLSRIYDGLQANSRPAVSYGYAFLPVAARDFTGLMLINCRNPQSPFIDHIVNFPAGGGAGEVVTHGDYTYVVQKNVGLHILDSSNPETTSIINTVGLPHMVEHVRVDGQYAYITDENNIYVVDINPVGSSHLVYTFSDPSMNISDLDLEGDTLYIADMNLGFRILDISQPLSPQLLKSFRLTNPLSCTIATGKAYVCNDIGLSVYDVTVPRFASLVDNYDIPGVTDVTVDGNLVYATGAEGLIYDLS